MIKYLFIILSILTIAQSKFNYGVNFEYAINDHSANFTQLPNIQNTGSEFTDTQNSKINYGLSFNYLLNKKISLGLNLNYRKFGVNFSSTEFIGNTQNINEELIPVYSNHNLETTLDLIEINPVISYQPFNNGFGLISGFGFSLPLQTNYNQYQLIQSEADVDFNNDGFNSEIYNPREGDIVDANSRVAVNFGLFYDFDINKSVRISPTIQYELGLNDFLNDVDWSSNSIRIGVRALFNFNKKQKNDDPKKILVKAKTKPEELKEEKIPPVVIDEKSDQEIDLSKNKADNLQIKNSKCCYLIITSTKQESEAAEILELVNSFNLDYRFESDSFYNEEAKETFYRVKSECFESPQMADEKKQLVLPYFKERNIDVFINIKCEE